MHFSDVEFPYEISLQETEDGYAIHVKGDKEKLKAKLELMEAYHNFRVKAKAAGLGHGHGHGDGHGCSCRQGSSGHQGLFTVIHKHLQAAHKSKHSSKQNKVVE